MDTRRQLNVLDIVEGTSVDGPGLRTSVYVAGCRHNCPGCHNPQSWSMDGGRPMTIAQILTVIEDNDFDVTITGGDPLYHPEEIYILTRLIKERMGKNIWLYTGFTLEEILKDEQLKFALRYVDTIVEGRFIQELADKNLRFRGSSNQQIINIDNNFIYT